VFIREIVSNASDALEKLRLADLQQGADPSGSALSISVTCDEPTGTLTVTDSGIGMSKEELVQCLGTIASSGTRSLVEKLKSQGSGLARLPPQAARASSPAQAPPTPRHSSASLASASTACS
jgi:molecular chaperone HtpG